MSTQIAGRNQSDRHRILSMAVAIVASFCTAASFSQTFSSYDDVAQSYLPENVLWHVIARDGKSKNYSDLLPLDGGTVGIAHFAKGGLNALYDNMDTDKYFGKDRATMRQQYSTTCRPADLPTCRPADLPARKVTILVGDATPRSGGTRV